MLDFLALRTVRGIATSFTWHGILYGLYSSASLALDLDFSIENPPFAKELFTGDAMIFAVAIHNYRKSKRSDFWSLCELIGLSRQVYTSKAPPPYSYILGGVDKCWELAGERGASRTSIYIPPVPNPHLCLSY